MQVQVTADDFGPAVNVVTWFLAVTSCFAVIARTATKKILSHIGADDYLIFVALILSIGICVSISLEVANGLGRHIDALSDEQFVGFQKATYCAELLYVLVVSLPKLSLLILLRSITPVAVHRRVILYLCGAVVAWGLASFLAVAVQCRAPEVWLVSDQSRCFHQVAWWSFFGFSSIALELVLLVLPATIIWSLQIRIKRKLLIYSCFVTRILVIIASIVQLVFLYSRSGSTDITFDVWPEVLAAQAVQSLGIVTACIPYLKPFLASLETGMIRADDLRRRGGSSALERTPASDASKGRSSFLSRIFRSTKSSSNIQPTEDIALTGRRTHATLHADSSHNGEIPWDAGSHTSQSRIILHTTSFTVASEAPEPSLDLQ